MSEFFNIYISLGIIKNRSSVINKNLDCCFPDVPYSRESNNRTDYRHNQHGNGYEPKFITRNYFQFHTPYFFLTLYYIITKQMQPQNKTNVFFCFNVNIPLQTKSNTYTKILPVILSKSRSRAIHTELCKGTIIQNSALISDSFTIFLFNSKTFLFQNDFYTRLW